MWEGGRGGGFLNINGVIDKVYTVVFPPGKKLGVEIFRVSIGGACYLFMKEEKKKKKKDLVEDQGFTYQSEREREKRISEYKNNKASEHKPLGGGGLLWSAPRHLK